ncbi:unnamed protein product [Bursaphelenchus okinawaensis]|uniref:Uncharacterized protein n=1 Tax=Bursaphelenchus okinawaensis TaxID=465554 RepID=A0A811LLZ1_9BILA|nr:unnamed protein product [Bursaphelenchus okinawaensis]CAG9123866.1 unnamed protein product [Bursaphelenchus okinawaensis]
MCVCLVEEMRGKDNYFHYKCLHVHNLVFVLSLLGIILHSTGIVFLIFAFEIIHWIPLIVTIVGLIAWTILFMGNIFGLPVTNIIFLLIFVPLGISAVFIFTYTSLLLSYRWFKQFLPSIPSRKYHLESVIDENLYAPKFYMLLLTIPAEILIIFVVYFVITVVFRDYVHSTEMHYPQHNYLEAKASANPTENTQETCFDEALDVGMINQETGEIYNDITIDSGYIVSV